LSTPPLLTPAFALALEFNHPIYDCIYLAAALATGRTLVTADTRFAAKLPDAMRSRVKLLAETAVQ